MNTVQRKHFSPLSPSLCGCILYNTAGWCETCINHSSQERHSSILEFRVRSLWGEHRAALLWSFFHSVTSADVEISGQTNSCGASPVSADPPVCACEHLRPYWGRPSSSWTYPLFHSPPCCHPLSSAAHPSQSWELKAAERKGHLHIKTPLSLIFHHYIEFPELMLYGDYWFDLWTADSEGMASTSWEDCGSIWPNKLHISVECHIIQKD